MNIVSSDFWINFWSNLGAGIIIGILLYIVFTNLPEKRNAKKNLKLSLEFLLIECEVNEKKLNVLDAELLCIGSTPGYRSQVLLAQNAWMLLSNTNLLPKINNPKLINHIFQLEDQIFETNRILREVFDYIYNHPGRNFVDGDYIKRANQQCSKVVEYLQNTKPYLTQEIVRLDKKNILDRLVGLFHKAE
jgi:hypothetical protein